MNSGALVPFSCAGLLTFPVALQGKEAPFLIMMRTDAAAWAAARCVGNTVAALAKTLEAAAEPEEVAASLRAVLQLFMYPSQASNAASQVQQQDPAVQGMQQALQQHAQVVGWSHLQHCFFEEQFPTWATAVLTVAAGDWLQRLNAGFTSSSSSSSSDTSRPPDGSDGDVDGVSTSQLHQLISDTFTLSPPEAALAALVSHLSTVLPKHNRRSGPTSTVAVLAVAADTAAELLLQRFAAPGSSGVWQLLQACDTEASSSASADDTQQQVVGHTATQPQQHQWQQQQQQLPGEIPQQQQQQQFQRSAALTAEQIDDIALLLATAVDRVQVQQVPMQLQPAGFVQHVLQQGLSYIANAATNSSSSSRSCGSGCSGSVVGASVAGVAGVPGAIAFTALVLQKYLTRGHSKHVAAALWQLLATNGAALHQQQQQPSAAGFLAALQQVLLKLSNHTAAAEKLLLLLLRLAAATPPPALDTSQQQQQQQQQQQASSPQLQALLCPLLPSEPKLRQICLQRILLGRMLPLPCLQLLLQILQSCQPCLIPAAAVELAGMWADPNAILHIPVPQQAFITAALVECIGLLPRELLDPTASPAAAAAAAAAAAGTGLNAQEQEQQQQQLAGLIPAILQGVSSRLASPLPCIRAQAMRVGRAFAASLDPSKPLFEEAGALPLLPEEQWPGAVPGQQHRQQLGAALKQEQQQQQQQQQQQKQQLAVPSKASSRSSSSSSKFSALERLQQVAAEPDSDDDEGFIDAAAAAAAAAPAAAVGAAVKDDGSCTSAGEQQQQQQTAGSTAPNTGSTGANSKSDGAAGTAAGTAAAAAGAEEHDTDDSLSDAGSDISASSLVAFDLQEDLAADEWWGADGLGLPDGKPLGLRAVAAAIRKQDDINAVLDALQRVEVLVRSEPDELPVVAPELARSLLHCRVPVWASTPDPSLTLPTPPAHPSSSAGGGGQQGLGLNPNAEVQRLRALTAVLSLSPLTAGDTVIAELYSPHLDQYQRMMIMDSLAAAAAEMADPRRAPRLAATGGPGQAPQLLPSAAAETAQARLAGMTAPAALQANSGSTAGSTVAAAAAAANGGGGGGGGGVKPSPAPRGAAGGTLVAPGLAEASSRVWGKVSLAKQKAAQQQAAANGTSSTHTATSSSSSSSGGAAAGGRRTFRNRFSAIAIRWAGALLKECDVRKHGVDLFGRDSLLLGRLLTLLGSFVEAAAATPAAVPLAAGLLELVKADQVSGHQEVFVRRCALVASSQVVRHLPPARLAGAMIGRQADIQDQLLVERLQWLMSWAQSAAAGDVDEQCRLLAAGCVAWHVELAESAMAAIVHLPAAEGPSLSGVGLGAAVAGGNRKAGKRGVGVGVGGLRDVEIKLPSVERLVLHQ